MKRLLAILVTAICGVGLLSLYVVPTAEAAPYTPTRNSLTFNNPAKSRAEERRIQTELDRMIGGAPAGSTISMAMYLFDQSSTTNALIAAHRRGVNVRFLIDDGGSTSQYRKLRGVLGTNKSSRSFVAMCRRSCMSNTSGSTIHSKLYIFSQVGRANNVSIISSANPHGVNIYNSWNNSHILVNNAPMYNALNKYFNDMLMDKTNLNYGWTATAGVYQVAFYPRRPARIAYLDVLNTVSCRPTRTVVRMAMWGFTNPRMDVARRLWNLHNAGCKVDVTLNRGRASRTIMRQLLKKSKKYGQMRVEDAWRDRNRNDYGELYVHHKALIINGRVLGRNQKVVWTGSQNLTSLGSLYNDDMILRVSSRSVYDAYSKNFSYIQAHYAKRLRTTPPPIILKSHRADARGVSPDQYTDRRAEEGDGG